MLESNIKLLRESPTLIYSRSQTVFSSASHQQTTEQQSSSKSVIMWNVFTIALAVIPVILTLWTSIDAGGWMALYISPRYTFSDIPDLSGKVAIVTGSNTGIGYVNAREMAKKGATVIVAARSAERGLDAVARITTAVNGKGTGSAVFLPLDLGSFKSVRQFAKEFRGNYSNLDILVLNAGVSKVPLLLP